MMAAGAVIILASFAAVIKPSIEGESCGGDLTAEDINKYLYSPSISLTYSRYLKCTWRIRSENTEKKVVLEVIESVFSIYCRKTTNVTVYDGIGLTGKVLRSWCGSEKPKMIVTDGSSATLVLYKQPYMSGRFKIRYYQGYAHNCGRLYAYSYYKYLTGSALHASRGRYACSWTMQTIGMRRLRIMVLRSQLQYSFNCQKESVTVYDGDDMSSPVLGKWCGNRLPTYVSTSQRIMVYLASDRPIRNGFKIRYWSTSGPPVSTTTPSPKCGGQLRPLTSFAYLSASSQQSSANNYYCKWTLLGSRFNSRVYVEVMESYLRYSRSCTDESVTVFDGSTTYSPTLERWCGSKTPTFTSSGRHLVIVFRSKKYRTGRFRLRYRESSDIQPHVESSKNVAGIVGGVVGAISVVIMMLLLGVLVWRWRKKPQLVNRTLHIPPAENRVYYTQATGVSIIQQTHVSQSQMSNEMTVPPSYAEVMSNGFQGILLGPPPTYQQGQHQVPYHQAIIQSPTPESGK